MSRRLEFAEGTSSKFWEVKVVGAEVTTNWGRIGTAGQSKSKTFADEAAAQRDVDAQLAKKLKSGYTELTPALVGAATQSPNGPNALSPAAAISTPAPASVASVCNA